MMDSKFKNVYPTDDQELLLKAALLGREEAFKAWSRWSEGWELDSQLDHGSFRLLPMVYKNLSGYRLKGERISILKGIYKQSWCRNQQLFHDFIPVIQLLKENDIEIMLLKGSALTLLYYHDAGARPMADMDIMVPMEKAEKAIRILKDNGWKAENEAYLKYNLRYGRSMMFYNADELECDIHWNPLFESLNDEMSGDYWTLSLSEDFHGIEVRVLTPCDQLLHTLIHGLKWNIEPTIRWVADAYLILTSKEYVVDWARFCSRVISYKAVLQVREALKYLCDKFSAPVPEDVMTTLSEGKITLAEKMIFRYDRSSSRWIEDSFRGKLHRLFIVYLRQSDARALILQIFGFIRFLIFRTRGKRVLVLWYYLVRKVRSSGRGRKTEPWIEGSGIPVPQEERNHCNQ
jgi:hypothetical protein